MIYCRNPARLLVFSSSVDKLVEWVVSQHTDPKLVVLLLSYLRSRGDLPCQIAVAQCILRTLEGHKHDLNTKRYLKSCDSRKFNKMTAHKTTL